MLSDLGSYFVMQETKPLRARTTCSKRGFNDAIIFASVSHGISTNPPFGRAMTNSRVLGHTSRRMGSLPRVLSLTQARAPNLCACFTTSLQSHATRLADLRRSPACRIIPQLMASVSESPNPSASSAAIKPGIGPHVILKPLSEDMFSPLTHLLEGVAQPKHPQYVGLRV